MRILGVDPGSIVTGFGIIDEKDNKPFVIEYGIIKLAPKSPLTLRLKEIYDGIISLIDKYHPECLSIETAFYGKNIQSTLKLGQARGVVIIAALNSGLEVSEYSPREIKKSVTDSGASSKLAVMNYVKAILSMEESPRYIDSSDALAAAMCHFFNKNNFITSHTGQKNSKKSWAKFIEQNKNIILK